MRQDAVIERPAALQEAASAYTTDGLGAFPVQHLLEELHKRYRDFTDGALANYIPELATVDPSLFGIAVATCDGFVYQTGDSDHLFTIQSISKAFVYAMALDDWGHDEVLRRIGVEPSGDPFNSITFDERNNRPFNPMVNAGAIAASALIKGNELPERRARMLAFFERFIGSVPDIDERVYRSEAETGHRNRAIAYLELNAGMIDEATARARRTEKGGEIMPEEAIEFADKQQIYYRRFQKRLRDRLKALITPELIEEHRRNPLGHHSDALSRVLNHFRRGEVADKYAIMRQPGQFHAYKIVAFSGVRGAPPRLVDDRLYTDLNEAYHAVFLLRVNDLMES